MTYRVNHGYMEPHWSQFATFTEALAFAREMRRVYRDHPHHTVSLTRPDNIDGAEDAKPWAHVGLTKAEWEEWTES